jgi:hypothetical protein
LVLPQRCARQSTIYHDDPPAKNIHCNSPRRYADRNGAKVVSSGGIEHRYTAGAGLETYAIKWTSIHNKGPPGGLVHRDGIWIDADRDGSQESAAVDVQHGYAAWPDRIADAIEGSPA